MNVSDGSSSSLPKVNPSPSSNAQASTTPAPSLQEIHTRIEQSQQLSRYLKTIYVQMIQCVAQYGIHNNLEIFKAADLCFDADFGTGVHNIVTIGELAEVLGNKVQNTLGANEIDPAHVASDRPGFFLLASQPKYQLYLLKEGPDGKFLRYDLASDAFVEASTLPITGKEKLVVLNKTHLPHSPCYVDTHTPDQAVNGKFFHEKQIQGKCGIHGLHAFVGYPFVNETALSLMNLNRLAEGEVEGQIFTMQQTRSERYRPSISQQHTMFEKARFTLAQTNWYSAADGNDVDMLCKLLHHEASHQMLDKKYSSAFVFSVRLTPNAIEFGHKHKLITDDLLWEPNFLVELLEKYDEEIAKQAVFYKPLQRQIQELKQAGALPTHRLLMQLEIQMEPFKNLKNQREYIEESLHGLAYLKKQFEHGDRLVVQSSIQNHIYAMRRLDSTHWVVIDSMNAYQEITDSPYEWIKEQSLQLARIKPTIHFRFIGLKPV